MRYYFVILEFFCLLNAYGQVFFPKNADEDKGHIMNENYWRIWNKDLQDEIDRKIDLYRKGEAVLIVDSNASVKVEQTSHSFIFGGNIFLYGQLKTDEFNRKYEDVFGNLFNSATIPFYWKTLEPEQGKPRYEERDASYIFRRPPVDPIVDFCERKNILSKGHAIIYGLRLHGHPTWMPNDREKMECYFEEHIKDLANRYKGRVKMWDVVNEPVDQANRGLMPDDYTYKSYVWATKYFPDSVIFNINDIDFHMGPTYARRYVELCRNLLDRGIRIDNVGAQMHIFNPIESKMIANGDTLLTPNHLKEILDCLRDIDKPIHISEVTICAPDSTTKGAMVQAIIANNLYRYWFSDPDVTGITWWNVVDGGGAPGEPSYSGIYDVKMNKKVAYEVLDHLINKEWKTSLVLKADGHGRIKFRGFKGLYKATWKNSMGQLMTQTFEIK